MKKTALAIAIPAVIVGVGAAGAWYTGSQVEQEISRGLEQVNSQLREAAPGSDMQMTLLGVERGLFSSQARYQLTLPSEEGKEPQILIFADDLEHGPFPLSRVAQGKLLPVMAQSNFTLEPTPFTQPLFAAAGGQPPLTGEMAIDYDGSQHGEMTLAALKFSEQDASLRLTPTRMTFDISGDYANTRMDGELAEFDLIGVEPESGALVRIEGRGLSMQADKQRNSAGFAVGPGSLSLDSLLIQAQEGPIVVLENAVVEEALSQNGSGLDQTIAYRIGNVAVGDHDLGKLVLALSARNLDQTALKQLAQTYNQIAFASLETDEPFAGELTPAQEAELQAQALRLLDGAPTLALDELSLTTANGEARLSLAVDLRKPGEEPASMEEAVNNVLAALKANAKVDKALIGDVVALQGRLSGAAANPAMLQQQADAASEMFSGIALNTGWARLEGDSLTSSLNYANERVNFNGQDMSVEEFVGLVMGSVGGR